MSQTIDRSNYSVWIEGVKVHVNSCQTYFAHNPSKIEAEHRGLPIPLEDLSPMDWLSTDLIKVKVKDKKMNFIIIFYRSSGFVLAYKLTGTKTHHIVAVLHHYVKL